ncbi:3-hydroxybutyryl-CoA dehydrogenase [Filimonas lacunae]|uniref:3-hydroxybutyryl-CoA dehydrogenase n=1 Tax=Filimonas lacunae TaxID=477680 RepID=A0A173MRB7_9BACT|nr:3-hydroxyacyl-CoA dehydrogenase NAD-binding domain-containing protein [Filimonas lacunae]BAV09921.1 3-hydroxybutyryl-CoA dehydrogenase [Filimonas lacunae]SIS81092.1 3-hydroxybutyryl-CoA dehydrogenase [Filimonas lacunae]
MSQTTVICVCGAGTMGSGIAQLAAQAGFTTIQFDMQENMLAKSRSSISSSLDKLVEKGKITADEATAVLSRISFTSTLENCVANVVIEAIIENKEAKTTLFNQLAALNTPDTIFATNTSSIAIDALAQEVVNPERVAGLHFFNPAPVMKLVEVIKGSKSSSKVINQLTQLAKTMGKTPVVCKDSPGFIVNRVARPYYLEAMRIVELHHTDIAGIDKLLEATGFKMGPFRLMDMIGMDVNFAVSNIVWEALDKPERLTPSLLQQQKVAAGELGRKTGKGFYQYL